MGTMMEAVSAEAAKPTDYSGVAGSVTAGLHAGMQIAERRAQLELQREALAQQREHLKMQQGTFVMSALKDISLEKDNSIKKVRIDALDDHMAEMKIGRLDDGTKKAMATDWHGQQFMAGVRLYDMLREHNSSGADELIKGLPSQVVGGAIGYIGEISKLKGQEAKMSMALSGLQHKQNLDERGIQNSVTSIGRAVDNAMKDPIKKVQTLEQGLHAMSDPRIVFTSQMKNDMELAYAVGVSGKSNISQTEINNIMASSRGQQLAGALQQNIGKPFDVRQYAPEMVGQLKSMMEVALEARKNQASEIFDSVTSQYKDSQIPQVRQAIDNKKMMFQKVIGTTTQEDKQQGVADVADKVKMKAQEMAGVMDQYKAKYGEGTKEFTAAQAKMKDIFKKKYGADYDTVQQVQQQQKEKAPKTDAGTPAAAAPGGQFEVPVVDTKPEESSADTDQNTQDIQDMQGSGE